MRMDALSALSLNTEKKVFRAVVCLSVICVVVFCLTILVPRVDGKLIGSDGIYYYAITRSVVLDQDVDFADDYALLGVTPDITSSGLAANSFALGSSLLWIPFFLIAHVVSLILNTFGLTILINGTGYLYEASICIGTIIYASVGFVLTYRILVALFGEEYSRIFWCVIGMWWATPAIYYVTMEPSMSHGLTIFSMALFLFLWQAIREESTVRAWALLGAAAGLVALCRWQDGIIAVAPIVQLGVWLFHKTLAPRRAIGLLLVYSLCTVVIFSPQLIMWQIIYESFLIIPQGNDFIQWTSPHMLETLFSTRHGLITWHPIVLLALFGLIPLWTSHRRWALLAIWMLFGELYINSAVTRWWADDAFGGRRFTSLMPLLAVPLIAFALNIRWRNPWFTFVIVALVIWNMLSLAQYRLGFVSKNEALTLQQMTIDRFRLPVDLVLRVLR